MYPLCPYQVEWKPGSPDGTLAGGGMPGPTLEVQVTTWVVVIEGADAASAGATLSTIAAQSATSAFPGVTGSLQTHPSM